MKNMNNITIKERLFTQSVLLGGGLAIIITLFFVTCENGGGGGGSTTITDDRINIEGTFSYTDIIIQEGAGTTGTPVFGGMPSGQEITYSIERVDGKPLGGISIDSVTGEITVSTGATKSSLEPYKVSATGTGEYKGTIEANVNIWVKATFAYDTVNLTASTAITQNPPTLPTSTYALRETTGGLSINESTGAVGIDPVLLSEDTGAGVYVVIITEGTEEYEIEIEIMFPQPADGTALKTLVNSEILSGNTNLNFIDTSLVTDMSYMFANAPSVNISKWSTGAATDMQHMFDSASTFNGNISGWNVGSVINMSDMFKDATAFNQDISGWTVNNVTNMTNMFVGSGLAGSEPSWYSATP